MLKSAPLAEWLDSPALQEASQQRSFAFSKRWLSTPLFTEIRETLADDKAVSEEDVLSAAQRFMARRDDLMALLDDLVAEAAADPFFRPPFDLQANEISKRYLLFRNQHLLLFLNAISAGGIAAKKVKQGGQGTVGFTGMLTLHQFLKSGGATFSVWEAPAPDDSFVGQDQRALVRVGEKKIEDGETWLMDGRRQTFVLEHATSDIVFLQAQVKVGAAPLAVEYNVETGVFAGASATDGASSRLQMMVTLLRLLGRDDAWPVVESLLDSPHFFVRWHVMREFLAMNAEAALPHLRRFANEDPHPEVRGAARQTLAMFFPGKEA